MNTTARVFLKAKEEAEIKQGFPWVFDNEIDSVKFYADDGSGVKQTSLADCAVKNGEAVEVFAKGGAFLGTGIINRASKITVRLIGSEHADQIFADIKGYWAKRIRDAYNIRRLHYSESDSCRLVFAEADFIPGLIVERYVDESGKVYLVVQFLALACEVFREEIVSALKETVKPYGIYERDDAGVRDREGLSEKAGWIGAAREERIVIVENGIRLEVDIAHGQKTGYFLDQKDNRRIAATYCHGKKVLDTFTHTGAFGLNAAKAGAKDVTSVDISAEAVELVKKNIALNGFEDRMKAVCADVFDLLKTYEEKGEKFDVIILDPPAFAKNHKSLHRGLQGYKFINKEAIKKIKNGGLLFTFSCSQAVDKAQFQSIVMAAAIETGRKAKILYQLSQPEDHPINIYHPEGAYLKGLVLQIM